MDSFELNKLIGAALGTVFVLFSVSLIGDAIFHSEAPETPGYAIAALEEAGGGEGEGEVEADITQQVFPLLASADAGAGESLFRRCAACHTIEQGGANKIGPNLYGVVNRPVASHEGFSYSAAMTEFSQGGSVHWDFDHLTHFLFDPKGYVRGTAMSFAGLKKPEDLANLLVYLNAQAASPAPLPEAAPAAAEGGAPAAEGGEQASEGAPPAEAAPQGGEPAPADQGGAPDAGTGAAPEPAPATPGAQASPDGDLGDPAQQTGGAVTGEGAGEAAPAGQGDAQPAEGQPAQPADGQAAPTDAQPAESQQQPTEDETPPPANE